MAGRPHVANWRRRVRFLFFGAHQSRWALCLCLMPAVEFSSVSKSFGARQALTDLSFEAAQGRVLGLLGPNGSGKTTTVRLMLNLFYPDAGQVRVFGSAPDRQVSDRIGYLPEERGLYRRMRVTEVLGYYARLKGARPSRTEMHAWLERLGIEEYHDQQVQQLSKGTAQKVQFIATLLHDPQLLILDEPFSGLDPLSREQLRAALQHVLAMGKTVILSTHDMVEAENLCDAFLMLSHGRKVLDAGREQIADMFGEQVIKLRCEGLPQELLNGSASLVERVMDLGKYQELVLRPGADAQQVLKQLAERTRIDHFEVAKPSLHDIFLRLAGASLPPGTPNE